MSRSRTILPIFLAAAMLPPTPLAHASGGEEEASASPSISSLPTLVAMDEIAVPIIDAGEIQGTLRFSLVIRAADDVGAQVLTEKMPELRAAALSAGINFASLRASPYRPIDVALLSNEIDAALKSIDPAVQQGLIVRVTAIEA